MDEIFLYSVRIAGRKRMHFPELFFAFHEAGIEPGRMDISHSRDCLEFEQDSVIPMSKYARLNASLRKVGYDAEVSLVGKVPGDYFS